MSERTHLLDRPLLPVADPEDARATYEALRDELDLERCRPIAIHVVEPDDANGDSDDEGDVDGNGDAVDEEGVTAERRAHAEATVDAMADLAAADGLDLDTEVLAGADIAGAIVEAAADLDASAIVFHSRGGSAWLDIVAGGVRTALIAKSDRPVVVLPAESDA